MHISENPRVFKVDQRHVHHKTRKMCGMKNIEVSVFDSLMITIGGGIGFCL